MKPSADCFIFLSNDKITPTKTDHLIFLNLKKHIWNNCAFLDYKAMFTKRVNLTFSVLYTHNLGIVVILL